MVQSHAKIKSHRGHDIVTNTCYQSDRFESINLSCAKMRLSIKIAAARKKSDDRKFKMNQSNAAYQNDDYSKNGRWDYIYQLLAHFASLSPIYYAKSSECIHCKRLKMQMVCIDTAAWPHLARKCHVSNLINRISTPDTGLKTRQTLINAQILLLKSQIPYSALCC